MPASSATSSEPVEEPMNTLIPAAPGRRSSSAEISRRSHACRRPRRRSRNACARSRARPCRQARPRPSVSGLVLGISKTAVTPPITAPREPDSRSSLCERPGSRKCTCESTTPGRMCRPRQSIRLARRGAGEVADLGDPAVADADVAQALPVLIDERAAGKDDVKDLRHEWRLACVVRPKLRTRSGCAKHLRRKRKTARPEAAPKHRKISK